MPATAVEQMILELINRARLDPAAESARDGIDLNEGLPAGTISAASKQPLAMNETLLTIAFAHDQDMIAHDYFGFTTKERNHNGSEAGPVPICRENLRNVEVE